MEALIIELGMSLQPLGVKYKTHSAWVTNSRLKFLWEKIDIFNLTVEVNNVDLKQPREKDQWLMCQFMKEGYRADELKRLN